MNIEKDESAKMRKSVVRKSVTRKYNTAKYETMDITVDHQHEIEWDSIENFRKKSNNITILVANDFEQTAAKVMEEFKLTNFAATVNTGDMSRRGLSATEKNDFDKLS
jgi:hypothetical protein